jgi:formate hydrogenlyase subunit 3/multisubunit Na+/H+ antiporter MnhD subunit
MHFWLPPAHSSAPAPVSAILSALMVKGSFYILLRLWFEAFGELIPDAAAQLLGALGAAAILWGSIQALVQDRLKLLVAYSTVAQLGYLFLLFPLAAVAEARDAIWTGGLVFLLAHAAAKAAMFLAAGNLALAAGHDRIKDLKGITGAFPLTVGAIGLAGISLVGIPPTAGFVGKWFLLVAGLHQGQWWWVAVLIIGGLLSAGYMIRLLTYAFTRGPESRSWGGIPWIMELSAMALALIAFLLGFAASWPARLLENLFSRGGGS